jgi:hypothetical protein
MGSSSVVQLHMAARTPCDIDCVIATTQCRIVAYNELRLWTWRTHLDSFRGLSVVPIRSGSALECFTTSCGGIRRLLDIRCGARSVTASVCRIGESVVEGQYFSCFGGDVCCAEPILFEEKGQLTYLAEPVL